VKIGRRLGQTGLLAALLGMVLFPAGTASADDIVFQDGKVEHNAKIVSETGDYVTIAMSWGTVRFSRASIRTVNGQPLGPAETATASSPSAATPTPGGNSGGSAAVTPNSSPTSAPASASALPTTAASPPPAPQGPAWKFEGYLLLLLAVGGVWTRCLQWVQRDLFERRIDPRFWSMAALCLPGVGALIYGLTQQILDRMESARVEKEKKAANKETSEGEVPAPADPSAPGKLQTYSIPDPAAHLAKKGRTRQGFEFLDTDRKSVAWTNGKEISSGLDLAQEMLEEALLEQASDVHIEPGPADYRVRFRLDGIMHERMSYPAKDGKRVVTSLKTLAEIDVAEKRKAQDGRFRARVGERDVDFRVATANSIHGEKMVIRILDHSRGIFDLRTLGMSEEMLATFQSAIQSRNGMILATGPTGSGKTSTLYAALRQLDASKLNIMTIEDPAEYELAGATQIAVNVKAGITYESGLRSILRQDPDVILVGEMRDSEATQIALRAALTGHLVFSSLHTKDAVGTISRLQDMGMERYQVASAMLMILAQRLVRMLCPDCRKPYPANGDEMKSIGLGFEPGQTLYAPGGCDKCLGTGYKGRTGIFELLVLDDTIRKAISEGADEATVTSLVEEMGFRNYRYDGAEKVLLGITTVEEVLQAI